MPHHDPDAPNPLAAAVGHQIFDQNDDATPAGPPRDPGSVAMRFIIWALLLYAISYTAWVQWVAPPPPPAVQTEIAPPGGLMRLSGRYSVGAVELLSGVDPSFEGDKRDQMAQGLVEQADAFAGTPEDRLRLVILEGELRGPEPALASLDQLETDLDETDDPPPYADVLRRDIASVRDLLADPPIAPTDLDDFRERHAWFADLALARGLDDASVAREGVLAKAQRTAITLISAISAFLALLLLGFILGIVAVVLVATGKVKASYRPHLPGGSVYLEVFLLFIAGFLLLPVLSGFVSGVAGGKDYSRLLIWLLLLIPFWAMIRGARAADFRNAMGWHTGKGLFREIAAGVLGYVACLPIFIVGVLLTLATMVVVSFFQSGEETGAPTHPILNEVDPSDIWSVLGVYAVAALWAPIVEESLFRGALYHHVRGRLHPILAALFVAFIFAVIHPQGLVAIPALMSLAVTFALLREWRGSLIAPVVGHALHNGALMTTLILALS